MTDDDRPFRDVQEGRRNHGHRATDDLFASLRPTNLSHSEAIELLQQFCDDHQ